MASRNPEAKYPKLVLGPKSIAGLERAAIQVMERRHPHLRFRIVRDDSTRSPGGPS